MLRQRPRKTVQDVYGNKFDPTKSHVTAVQQYGGQKTNRAIERSNGYIISSNMPHNGATIVPLVNTAPIQKSTNSGRETSRRKSARASNKIRNEKYVAKENFANDENKRATINSMRTEKFTVYDNKTYNSSHDLQVQQHHQQQHHQQQHHQQQQHHHQRDRAQRSHVDDEDKDDDTDEFLDLIRRTIETAIGKSISELLNRNFRELSSKVDRFSAELKNTNGLLNQLQNEIGSKIGHYGEENSRHFRYLCMKSEYDKMFYQHQTLVATDKSPAKGDISIATKKPERRKKSPKPSRSNSKIQRKENETTTNKNDSCPCLNKKCQTAALTLELREERAPSPVENISPKSSDIGMREVLEQIKTFCTQRQIASLDHGPSFESPGSSHQRNAIMKPEKFIQVYKAAFEDDNEAGAEDDGAEDEWEISSDGMTPRNITNDSQNSYGGNTSRGGSSQRGNNGAGDG